jgi:hypothetical protein
LTSPRQSTVLREKHCTVVVYSSNDNEKSTMRTEGQDDQRTTTSVPCDTMLPRLGADFSVRSKRTGSRNATDVSGDGGIKVDLLPDAGTCGAGFANTSARDMTVFPTGR